MVEIDGLQVGTFEQRHRYMPWGGLRGVEGFNRVWKENSIPHFLEFISQ